MAGIDALSAIADKAQAASTIAAPPDRGAAYRAAGEETILHSPDPIRQLSAQRLAKPDPLMIAIQLAGGPRINASVRGYHGSPVSGLTELRPSERGPFGPGVYLSPNTNVSQRYAGPAGKLYSAEVDDIFHGTGSRPWDSSFNQYEVWRQQGGQLLKAVSPDKQSQVSALLQKMQPNDGYQFFQGMAQLYGSKEAAQNVFKAAGFKGISGHVDGPEIAYFDKLKVGTE